MRYLVGAVAFIVASSANAEDIGARRQFLPTVRAATDCATRAIASQGLSATAGDDVLRDAARRAFGAQCQTEGQRLVLEHDRLYGPGTGRGFVDGPYFSDFPRAARARMASAGTLNVTVNKPVRCPDMLQIYEVQDAGREFAAAEQSDLQRSGKGDAEVLTSFISRMDQQLRLATHAMARPVLEEFRRLPPAGMEACFPGLRPVLAEARQLEVQRAEVERQRLEAEQRRAEEQRLADQRRAEELRLAELRRAEAQRAEEERRKAAEEEAARKRAEEQRAEEERQREERRPINVLKRLYAQYAYVKQCFEFRSGYVQIFISDNEYGRARTAIKAIESKVKSLDSSINTDQAWAEAASGISMMPDRGSCQLSLTVLMSAFQEIAPDAAAPKKDF